MKKMICILPGIFFIFCAVTGAEESDLFEKGKDVTKLTLQDCFVLALNNNVDIAITRNDPVISEWQIVSEKGIFDPSYTFSLNYGDTKTPLQPITRLSTGLNSIQANTLNIDSAISGLIPTGTQYKLHFSDLRTVGTTTRFHPEYQGFLGLDLTQPLLRNFGLDPNLARIRIAKVNKNISDDQLRLQLITTFSTVQKAYWNYVFSIKHLAVERESLQLAKTLLEDNRKRVSVGVLPPIEITQSEAGVAEREEAVIVGEHLVSTSENALKILIYKNMNDIMEKNVIPLDEPKIETPVLSVKETLALALENRPDYLIEKKKLTSSQINKKFLLNQKLPDVNFVGEYNRQGIERTFGDTLTTMESEREREWYLGVEVGIPLGNRVQRSAYEIARIQEKIQALEIKKMELGLVQEVDNAVGVIETNIKRVKATIAARKLAEEALTAEIHKLESGTSTSHNVLQFQDDLSQAKAHEISAIIDLNKSIFDLFRVEGTVLKKLSIDIEE